MKLFHKIFLCFLIIFGISFQAAGLLLLNYVYDNSIEQEKRYAIQQYQYNKYIFKSMLYTNQDYIEQISEDGEGINKDYSVPVAIYDKDRECVYSGMSMIPDTNEFQYTDDNSVMYRIVKQDMDSSILVQGCITYEDELYYLATQTDIGTVIAKQDGLLKYFQKIYLVIIAIGFPTIFIFTSLIVSPIKKLSKAAKRIAGGNYSERIKVSGRDEIGDLAGDFNQMAVSIEEKIDELSYAAKQKEDFTANFAHELKTPMTSVIGYADMLYHKELPPEEVKSAAYYIWSEGMRLESLSQKLMDLFVLDKQEFVLEQIDVEELFDNLKESIVAVCSAKGVSLHVDMQPAMIEVEHDLFKTMLLNIVDNSIKADSSEIKIHGSIDNSEKKYSIAVEDDGKGIPPGELDRITEAFYMVDKSRSRKQHGAGIGMALVSKIIVIHKGEMNIESDGHSGTKIEIIINISDREDCHE